METPITPETSSPVMAEYTEELEKARKKVPALLKRMSNTIPQDQTDKLTDSQAEEFNPDFSYPDLFDLEPENISSRAEAIRSALVTLDELEAQGYTPTLNDRLDKEKVTVGLDNIKMLELGQSYQKGEGDLSQLSDEFIALNEKMTGAISPELYQGIVNSIWELIRQIDHTQPIAQKIADELTKILPPENGSGKIVSLAPEEFEAYKHAYNVIFGPWVERMLPPKEEDYSPAEMAEVFANALVDMKLDLSGWSVRLDDNAPSLKISQEDKLITVPRNREPLNREEMSAKLVHEFGHITRGLNGSYISRSAEHGIPDYLDAEEGLMSYGEAFISGKQEANVTYVERYFGAALLTGVSGEKQDFKNVFTGMWRLRALLDHQGELQAGDDISLEQIAKAKRDSLMNAKRLFRGGDGKTPGMGWTKDKAYYEGMAKLTYFLEDFANKIGIENVHLLFAAKFDPTNNLHNRYLGMLPLERL